MGSESKAMRLLAEWDWTLPDLPVDSWWFFTVVLVLLVVFIWVVARLTTHTTDDIDPAEIDRQMLSAVSELRSQGELTQEEFRSIKSRLVTRLAPSQTSSKPDEQPDDNDSPEEISTNTTVEKDDDESVVDDNKPQLEDSSPEETDKGVNGEPT